MVNEYLQIAEDFDSELRGDGFTFIDEPGDTVIL
jgi:hypothetical protein